MRAHTHTLEDHAGIVPSGILHSHKASDTVNPKAAQSVHQSPTVYRRNSNARKILKRAELFKDSFLGEFYMGREEPGMELIDGRPANVVRNRAVVLGVRRDFTMSMDANSPVRIPNSPTNSPALPLMPANRPMKKHRFQSPLLFPSIREARSRLQNAVLAEDSEQQELQDRIGELDRLLAKVRKNGNLRSNSVTREAKAMVLRKSVDAGGGLLHRVADC